ncbi:hypothetical protein FB451DRAFT_164451 [Mycena latifolia]|nr:hypothetical protein FB451DRAFT_164451 [Mycena latifolia]
MACASRRCGGRVFTSVLVSAAGCGMCVGVSPTSHFSVVAEGVAWRTKTPVGRLSVRALDTACALAALGLCGGTPPPVLSTPARRYPRPASLAHPHPHVLFRRLSGAASPREASEGVRGCLWSRSCPWGRRSPP